MIKFTLLEKNDKKLKIFLGGTCNNSTWRKKLIKKLKIDYFDPVVDDWTEECYEEELRQRKICDFLLYVITPKMIGFYSIAEVIDDSNKNPDKTIFCYLLKDGEDTFKKEQLKSLETISKMIKINGGKVFENLIDISDYVNNFKFKSK